MNTIFKIFTVFIIVCTVLCLSTISLIAEQEPSQDPVSSASSSDTQPPDETSQKPQDIPDSNYPENPEPEPQEDHEPGEIYGTPEAGIVLGEEMDITMIAAMPALMNPGFSEGLKFWASLNEKLPSEVASVVDSGENKFLLMNFSDENDGVITPRFKVEKLVPGQRLVVIYDWSGNMDFNVKLTQWDSSGATQIASGFGKVIYEAQSENEWNTSVTAPARPVKLTDDGYYELYFTISVCATQRISENMKIDNLRLGYANANGVIYDFDGNEILGEARKEDEAEEIEENYIMLDDGSFSRVKDDKEAKPVNFTDSDTLTTVLIIMFVTVLAVISVILIRARQKSRIENFKSQFDDSENENNDY